MNKATRKQGTKAIPIQPVQVHSDLNQEETLDGQSPELGEITESKSTFDPSQLYEQIFEKWDDQEFEPTDYMIESPGLFIRILRGL
jgi:hypothetical protein